MREIREITVRFQGRTVGRLAAHGRFRTAFQYDGEWLRSGFSISPLSLPPEDRVFIAERDPFDGLFGVFSGSLPGSWGRLLTDLVIRENGGEPQAYGPLERLAIVGNSGLGALTYEPDLHPEAKPELTAPDRISDACRQVLQHDDPADITDPGSLFALGGSSGGSRPKILTEINGEDWIIKFPSLMDPPDIGEEEYAYSICARRCGIEVPETRLFPSGKCGGFFGVRRYDRERAPDGTVRRIHCVTVSGLLEASHNLPCLDYDALLRLVRAMTGSHEEVIKMYRRMCFNVFAHNRDDHSDNFSFLYDAKARAWMLAPAYDLTWSNSVCGEHATLVHGNGMNPGMKDVMAVAAEAGISRRKALEIAEEIREITEEDLGVYLRRKRQISERAGHGYCCRELTDRIRSRS